MILLGRKDNKPFCVDNSTSITFSEVTEFTKELEKRLPEEIHLAALGNTATSAALYISLLESKLSFVICGIKDWKKTREGLEKMYNKKFAVVSEKNLTNECHEIGILGNKMIYAELQETRKKDETSRIDGNNSENNGFICLSTSGSSGAPKLVKITKRNIQANTEGIIESLDLDETDSAFVCLPLNYTYALSQINTSAKVGSTVWISDKSVVQAEFSEELVKSNAKVFAGVPYTFEMLQRLNYKPIKESKIKKITQAGGKLGMLNRKEIYLLSKDIDADFYIMYGQTEATARISCFCVNRFPDKIGSVGRKLSNIELEISESGEIIIKGPSVTPGYIKNAKDFTNESTRNYHKTGDIARLDKDHFIYIEGRLSRFSKIAGRRINLDVIEEELEQVYKEKVYIVSDDNELFIAAKILPGEKRKPTIEGIHRSKIKWVKIDEVPLTNNGKVDYSSLKRKICINEY